jgi:hypothetical protein
MKKIKAIFFISALIVCSFIFLSSSCHKSNDQGSKPPSVFTWTFRGSIITADLDSAYVHYDLTPYLIKAITGTNFITNHTREISFSMTSFNPGNFSIVPGPGSNILYYYDELGYIHSGVSGTLSITSNSNNLMNGNFSAVMAGPSGNELITGSFTNVPVKP